MKKLLSLIAILWMVGLNVAAQNPILVGSATQCLSAPYTYSVVDDNAALAHSWVVVYMGTTTQTYPAFGQTYYGSILTREDGEGIAGQFYVEVMSYYAEGQVDTTRKYFTVNANPTVNVTPAQEGVACGSMPLLLSGADYYWLYDVNDNVIDEGVTIDVSQSGYYRVGGTDGQCVGGSETFHVKVEGPPTIIPMASKYPFFVGAEVQNNSVSICGGLVGLAYDFQGGQELSDFTVSWTKDAMPLSATWLSVEGGVGTYKCTIVSNNTCIYEPDPITVDTVALPEFVIKKKGTTEAPFLQIKEASLTHPIGYIEWYKGKKVISGADGLSYTPSVDGNYLAKIYVGGCWASSNKKKVTFPVLKLMGIQDLTQNSFVKISIEEYPNYYQSLPVGHTYIIIKYYDDGSLESEKVMKL